MVSAEEKCLGGFAFINDNFRGEISHLIGLILLYLYDFLNALNISIHSPTSKRMRATLSKYIDAKCTLFIASFFLRKSFSPANHFFTVALYVFYRALECVAICC